MGAGAPRSAHRNARIITQARLRDNAGRKAENVLDMLNGRVLERSVGNNLDRTRCAFDLGCRLIGIEHADHDDVGCSWGWGLVMAVTLGESGIGREKRSGKGAGRKKKSGHDYPCSFRKAAA